MALFSGGEGAVGREADAEEGSGFDNFGCAAGGFEA
jgi:hypothetical protein